MLCTLIIKILFQKKLVSVLHAALPYLCPSNYPTLATPLKLAMMCYVDDQKLWVFGANNYCITTGIPLQQSHAPPAMVLLSTASLRCTMYQLAVVELVLQDSARISQIAS